MLISIRITSQLKESVDQLIQMGHYPDFNAAAVVALENLVVTEQEHASLGQNQAPQAHISAATPATLEPSTRVLPPQPPSDERIRISCFSWMGTPEKAKGLVHDFPADRFSRGDTVPVERWLFGQQNRLLPLKVNARLLLAQLAAFKIQPVLSLVADEVSWQAATATTTLQRIDQQRGHKKEDLLATGLPTPDSDKSKQRYADQFIASENSSGELSGMLIDWKLATVERKKGKTFLYPTPACPEFADLPNPLLDTTSTPEVIAKFSEAELQWMLRHLAEHVHVESYAFATLLKGIQAGANDPSTLDSHLRKSGALADNKNTSNEFVSTQRAGALSRMADLDLIRRIRNGVRITYASTPRGDAWLKEFNF